MPGSQHPHEARSTHARLTLPLPGLQYPCQAQRPCARLAAPLPALSTLSSPVPPTPGSQHPHQADNTHARFTTPVPGLHRPFQVWSTHATLTAPTPCSQHPHQAHSTHIVLTAPTSCSQHPRQHPAATRRPCALSPLCHQHHSRVLAQAGATGLGHPWVSPPDPGGLWQTAPACARVSRVGAASTHLSRHQPPQSKGPTIAVGPRRHRRVPAAMLCCSGRAKVPGDTVTRGQ